MNNLPERNQPQVAVGAIVVKDRKILLVRRARPPGAGLWAIPGGRVNLGESLRHAVEREILEETAVAVRAREPAYTCELIERDESGAVRFHYVILDFGADYLGGKPHAGGDASDACWIGAAELVDLDLNESSRRALRAIPALAFLKP